MKKFVKSLLVIGSTTAVTLSTAFGQPGGLIRFDEFGHMTINGLPGPGGVLAVDPSTGLTTLCYQLPFPANPGDILLLEQPQATQASDLIRFLGGNQVYFYSDFNPNDPLEPGNLADKNPIPPIGPVFRAFDEMGVEGGLDGLFGYAPGPADIGGSTAFPASYDIISDGMVPEPGAMVLTSLGGLMLLVLQQRRRAVRG